MSSVVHIQTTIQTTFAVLDEDGNAIQQQPIVAQLQKFSPEAFAEAHTVIADARDQASASMEAESLPDATGGKPAAKARTRPKR